MKISSSAFQEGKPIPSKHAYHGVVGGKNISPPLFWVGEPEGTQSFALSIIDLHPVANSWIHWLVINITKDCKSLSEAASGKKMQVGSKELYNSYGEIGYGGPQPPKGSGPHSYEITIYALNTGSIDLSVNSSLTVFRKAIGGKVIASAKTTGIYER